jgi:hypothetical protein
VPEHSQLIRTEAALAPLLPQPPIEPDDTTPDLCGTGKAAVLLSYSLALWLEDAAALHTDVLVLAVALTLTLARTQRTADAHGRLMACVLLPTRLGAIAVGAALAVGSACCVLPIPRRRTPAPSPASPA